MKTQSNSCFGIYTKEVMKHFKSPKNLGKIKNPDGVGTAGNIVCGDKMDLYIKIGKNKKGAASAKGYGEPMEEIIKDIKFETYGCVAAISTSSMITELAKGKTISEAIKLEKDDIIKSLGGLPSVKFHCSILAIDALSEALYDYFVKNKKEIPEIIKKRHDRIEKANKIINERYKKWI